MLDSLQVVGGGFAGTAVLSDLKADFLAFDQRRKTGALYCRDVNEHIFGTIFRLDKAVAFGCIKKLHCSNSHIDFLSIGHTVEPADCMSGKF